MRLTSCPLYVDASVATGVQLPTRIDGDASTSIAEAMNTSGQSVSSASANRDAANSLNSRRSITVNAGQSLSFGTYFNAFPASYWRRWTDLQKVVLSVQTRGEGMVIVYKSNGRGVIQRVDAKLLSGEETNTFTLPLAPFGDGGWYWFDLAGTTDLELVEANWLGDIEPRADVKAGQATVQITTMNKVEYCINNIRALGESPEIFDAVHEFLIVDQGTQKVQDHEDFEEVVKPLSGKFRIINQGNLGGSGGFSRGMFEAVNNGSDYVLLLDDDVIVEPESILRMVTFANYCKEPTTWVRTCSTCSTVRFCTRSVRLLTRGVTSTLSRTMTWRWATTWVTTTCVTPRGCTAAWTWTTTAGGCASSRPPSSRKSVCPCLCS